MGLVVDAQNVKKSSCWSKFLITTLLVIFGHWTLQPRDGIHKKSRDGEREKFRPAQTLVYTLRISRPPHLFCVTMQERESKTEFDEP